MRLTANRLITPYAKALNIIKPRYHSFISNFFCVFIFILILSGFSSIVPLFLREAADLLSQPGTASFNVLICVAAYALAWTLSNAMDWMKSIATSYVMVRCDTAFYKALFECFLKIPPYRQQSLPKGEVLADFDRSMSSFGQINQTLFWVLTPMLIEFLFVFLILWKATSIVFSALFLIAMIALFSLAFWISLRTQDVHLRCFEATNNLTGFLVEKLDASHEVILNSAQKKESKKLNPFLDSYAQAVFSANTKMAILLSMQVVAIGLALLTFSLSSSYLTMHGSFSVGDFVMIVSYVVQLTAPFAVVASSLIGLKRDYLALDEGLKYFELVESEPNRNQEIAEHHPIFEVSNHLTNQGKVLTFKIESGKTYAICGPSGCGKTTLINAMLGINTSSQGSIYFRGMEVSNLSSTVIADQVSVVSQQPFVFIGTLRENLLYGTEEPSSDNELLCLLDILGLDLNSEQDFDSLDSIVGGENRPLSGGEKQRLAIARALLRKKPVMVLDEPTSALDMETEFRVINLLKDRVDTLIVITHRETTKAMADELISFQSLAVKDNEVPYTNISAQG
ncbi:ATP-binding cassette domain-containing protein [Metapseudomonas resinovorans]|uniref:ATP-binding cassette domain-containing protein n=1 Tax=Metapseudomonas resinovorans TaxID=53412 RepID=UPI00131ECA0E|nr:ABC transporter ATP-binding protein [Pseudomonas resinovorans]